jgi:hypothetical protein
MLSLNYKAERHRLILNEDEKTELRTLKLSDGTLLARELMAVAYANGATASAQGDAATISPSPR